MRTAKERKRTGDAPWLYYAEGLAPLVGRFVAQRTPPATLPKWMASTRGRIMQALQRDWVDLRALKMFLPLPPPLAGELNRATCWRIGDRLFRLQHVIGRWIDDEKVTPNRLHLTTTLDQWCGESAVDVVQAARMLLHDLTRMPYRSCRSHTPITRFRAPNGRVWLASNLYSQTARNTIFSHVHIVTDGRYVSLATI